MLFYTLFPNPYPMMRKLVLAFIFSIFLSSATFALVSWSLSATDSVSANPVLAGNKVIFVSYDGRIYAINADSGSTVWTYTAGEPVALDPKMPDSDTVAVSTVNGTVILVSAQSGLLAGSFKLPGKATVFEAGEGKIFAGIGNSVVALDRKGAALWNSTLPKPPGQLGYSSGRLYFTSAGKLHSIDTATGRAAWAADAEDSFLSQPSEYGNTVYFGATDGKLYAIDRQSGLARWTYATGGWIMSPPFSDGSAVYFVSNDRSLYALSTEGKLKFKFAAGEGSWGRPALYESQGRTLVVFSSNEGKAYAVDAGSGKEAWSFSTYGKPGSPIRRGQNFIFGTSKGKIYSLSPFPICSFSSPSQLSEVGKWQVDIEGKASSDSPIRRVEVRAGNGNWVLAEGEEDWIATVDFANIASGIVSVECKATDASGKSEQGEFSSITLLKSDSAAPSTIYASAPAEVNPQDSFTLSAKDRDGRDLKGVTVDVAGEKKKGNSPFAITLGKSGKATITLEKPGFETATVTVSGRGESSPLPLIIGGVVLLALPYFFVIRKMLEKRK
jgi:outer membrane protein assembly factor BamB